MAVFIVRFEHPDEEGWQRWVRRHLDWIAAQVEAGTVVASGPSVDTPVRAGLLVMRAEDEAALRAVIATDPFAEHGIIADMQVTRWDPLFGALRHLSTNP
jgi:uncharacterized protein